MVFCKICNKEFKFIRDLNRHLSGKRPCGPKRDPKGPQGTLNENMTFYTEKPPEYTQMVLYDPNKHRNYITVKCEYCNKELRKKNLRRHYINSCKKISVKERKFYVYKHDTNQNTVESNKLTTNIKKINYIDNSTTNNLNNNNLINVSNFDEDDYSHLTYEDMKKICSSGYDMYAVLGDYLCRNEKNINFAIPNKKEDMVHVIKNNRLDVVSLRDFKEAKMDRSTIILGDIFDKLSKNEDLTDIETRTLKDLLDIDKFKQHFKYEQYLNELYRQLLKFNEHFRKTFKTRKYKNAIFNSVITDLKHKLNPKINLN